MKKHVTIILVWLVAFAIYASWQGAFDDAFFRIREQASSGLQFIYSFSDAHPKPVGTFMSVTEVLNDKLYLIGGGLGSTCVRTNVYMFDGDNWEEVSGMPTAGFYSKSTVLNNNIYVLPGGNSMWAASTNFYRFDGTNWHYEAGYPFAAWGLPIVAFKGNIYGMGNNNYNQSTNVYKFNGSSWNAVNGLPWSSAWGVGAVCGDYLYFHRGVTPEWTPKTNVCRFDGTNWTEIAGLPKARHSGIMFSPDTNTVVFMGGSDRYGDFYPTTNVFMYSVSDGIWMEVNGIPQGNALGSAVKYNNNWLIQQGIWSSDTGTNIWQVD